MFLHPSVSHSVHGGLQGHTQGRGGGVWLVGLQAHTQGEVEGSGLGESPGPHWGGGWGDPGPGPGEYIPACTEADTPQADGYCSGRYAFYWNAFLLILG